MTGRWVAPLEDCGVGGALKELRANGLADAPMLQPLEVDGMRRRAAAFPLTRRALLVSVLRDQVGPDPTEAQRALLDRLAQPDSVTVVAGHQLVTALGPLYVHAKVAETAALASFWTKKGVPTVPIFWMASEDHDIEEVRRIFWRGSAKGSWSLPDKPLRSGVAPAHLAADAIGRWVAEGGLPEPVRWAAERSEDAYRTSANLADATRKLMGQWHPDVLVLDASDARLKAEAAALWEDEIRNQSLYATRNEAGLAWNGQEPPVPFRPSALFALDPDGSRFRLDRDDLGQWHRADGRAMGRDEDMLRWAEEFPECLSPNALLRPIYQEWILPNAAYTGGAGELAYAYQLAPYWRRTGAPHGVWRLRHSGVWLPHQALTALGALGSLVGHIARGPWDQRPIRDELLRSAGVPSPDASPVTDALSALAAAHYARPGLERSVAAWVQRVRKEEARMVERLRREAARTESIGLRRLEVLHETTMPQGVLQERVWTLFDLVEHGGQDAVSAYVEAYSRQPVWDAPGWWEFT